MSQRVQPCGYKGVISHLLSEEALSIHFSLWTVKEGNHVFDYSQLLNYE